MQNVIKVLYVLSGILLVFGMATVSSIEILDDISIFQQLQVYFPFLMCFIAGAFGVYFASNFFKVAAKFYANVCAIVKDICIAISKNRKYRKIKYSYTFFERFNILYDEYLDNFYQQHCY